MTKRKKEMGPGKTLKKDEGNYGGGAAMRIVLRKDAEQKRTSLLRTGLSGQERGVC